MFARLLNALLHLFRRPRADEPPPGGPPAHWLKLREQGPPPHWLETARRAGQVTGFSTENNAPDLPSSPVPDEGRNDDRSVDVQNNPEPPAATTTRLQMDPRRGDMRNTAASHTAVFGARTASPLRPIVWPSKREDHDRNQAVNFSERSSGTSRSRMGNEPKSAPTAAPSNQTPTSSGLEVPRTNAKETNENIFVRFFRRSKKTDQPVQVIREVRASNPSQNEIPQKQSEALPVPPRPSSTSTVWPRTSETSRLAPIIFHNASRPSHSAFRNPPRSSPAFPREGSAPDQKDADIATSKRSIARAETPISPVLRYEAGSRHDHEMQQPAPLRWSALPSPSREAATRFSEQSASHEPRQTRFARGEPNWWPDLLPDDPSSKETNWRSVMRQIQRSQRLEKEQRGY